jgi:hypothetical protein
MTPPHTANNISDERLMPSSPAMHCLYEGTSSLLQGLHGDVLQLPLDREHRQETCGSSSWRYAAASGESMRITAECMITDAAGYRVLLLRGWVNPRAISSCETLRVAPQDQAWLGIRRWWAAHMWIEEKEVCLLQQMVDKS